jgi:WD40-like Beta Propeller Repeat
MSSSNNLKNHVHHHVMLPLALLVLIGAAIALSTPPASTANNSTLNLRPPLPIWSPPINVGPGINSIAGDAFVAISPDGLSLYFASSRAGGLVDPFDMYVSQRANVLDPWGTPINLGPALNTTSDESNPAFSRDGHFLFFQSNRTGGQGGIDIWMAHRNDPHDDFDWEPPVNLGAAINSTADDQGPYYFEDEIRGARQLYFGSTRSGLGGDIYVSEQNADGSFGPATVVPELSSPQNESDPWIRSDGLEIFFQSMRFGSIGRSDLWVATRGSTADAWSTPVNLGNTINTASQEQNASLSSDGMTLFFASDRPGGSGGLDLYMITRTLPMVRSKNITVAADDSCAANISPGDVDAGSFDPVSGGPLTLSLDPAAGGPFGLGPHTVRLIATDDRGVTNSALAIVTVVDQTPPVISNATVDNPILLTPNHQMVGVTVSYTATDNCGAVSTGLSISSNELINGTGDGDTEPDWEIVDAHHVRLRAERSGEGCGRIYTIVITAIDSQGNTSTQTVSVTVPHD